nr:glycoside hydrolase domain-containing protein [Mycobacterium sp. PS03-16]
MPPVPRGRDRPLAGGHAAGVAHAKRRWEPHVAASGFCGAPIYSSIDDERTLDQYKQQVAPYLEGWEAVPGPSACGRPRSLQDLRTGRAGRHRLVRPATQPEFAGAGREAGGTPAPGRDRLPQGGRRRSAHNHVLRQVCGQWEWDLTDQ